MVDVRGFGVGAMLLRAAIDWIISRWFPDLSTRGRRKGSKVKIRTWIPDVGTHSKWFEH